MGAERTDDAEADPLAGAAMLIALAERVVAEGPPLATRRERRRATR